MSARTYACYWGLAGVVLLLDQVTKVAVRRGLPLGDSFPVVPNVFYLSHLQNSAGAFGKFAWGGPLLVVVSAAVSLYLIVFGGKLASGSRLRLWSLSCILGGAVGNLVDRLRFGAVTDFLDFQVWPVFNVADITLTVGAGLLAIHLVLHERRAQAEEGPSCDPS